MKDLYPFLPFVNVALLAALAVSAARLIAGAPTRRERVSWGAIAAAATYASAHWLFLLITIGGEAFDGPRANLLRWLVLSAGVLALITVAPTLRRQRAADRNRADAEERFRRTMDGSTEPMALVGRDGRYQYVNAASLALFRYPASEVIGKHYSEFLPDPTENGANVRRAIEPTFGRASVQRRLRRGDGTEMIVETEMIGLGDGNMLFVGHDITERVELANRLERERQRLQLAQKVSHVGSVEIDFFTGERWWSAETFRLFGMEPSEAPPPFDLARMRVHPDDREISEQSTREVLQGKEHAPVTFRLVMPDGQIRHVVMHVHLERTEDGEPLRVTRVVTDITELHDLQAELERERIRLRYAQEISRVGSGEWNLQTGVTWWSDAMFHLLGFEPGSVEPSREQFIARVHPDDRPLHNDALARLIAGHQPGSTVLRIALPDGTVRSTLCQLQLEPDEHGAPHLVTGVLSDITDFLALQEQLGRAKRLEAIGTLTAGIAHDFNNLLTVIGGSVELAATGDVKRLEQAEQGVQRATALVRQLLQFSRPGAEGTRDESVTLVDLRALV